MSEMNPAPVGADALMRLVDAYAETRHTCGDASYNAKSKASRDVVLAALASAAQPVAVPPGYVLVPDAANMTDAQAEAIAEQANCCGGIAYDIYRAALAAVPKAAPEDWGALGSLGWQRVVCPACGSDMAQAAPKAAPAQPDAETPETLGVYSGIAADDVTDPTHPRYVAGFKAGHAAGKMRASHGQAPAPAAVAQGASLARELRLLANVQDEAYPNFRAVLLEAASALDAAPAAQGDAPTPDVQAKIDSNTWDSLSEVLPVLKAASRGKWGWPANPRCKYIELRIDMRDGGCLIRDREGVRISPEQLAHQSHPGGMPWSAVEAAAVLAAPAAPGNALDSERLDWLASQTRNSYTGISFDWCKHAEDGRVLERGYRFMSRAFLGARCEDFRAAIDAARAAKEGGA